MAQKRKNAPGKGRKRQPHSLNPIQPNAAGIDLGSREHCVAGPPLPDGSPNVKHFGTTTRSCCAWPDGLTSRRSLLSPWKAPAYTESPYLKSSIAAASTSNWSMLARLLMSGPQNRHDRLPVDSITARLRIAPGVFPNR